MNMKRERKLESEKVRYALCYVTFSPAYGGIEIKSWYKNVHGMSLWTSDAEGRELFYEKPILTKKFLSDRRIDESSRDNVRVVKVTRRRYTIQKG